jgi:hypothetical protein
LGKWGTVAVNQYSLVACSKFKFHSLYVGRLMNQTTLHNRAKLDFNGTVFNITRHPRSGLQLKQVARLHWAVYRTVDHHMCN